MENMFVVSPTEEIILEQSECLKNVLDCLYAEVIIKYLTADMAWSSSDHRRCWPVYCHTMALPQWNTGVLARPGSHLQAGLRGHWAEKDLPGFFQGGSDVGSYDFFLAVLSLGCCSRAFSSLGEWGYSLLPCKGFSSRWLLFLWSTGCKAQGPSSWSTQTQ